MDAKIKRQLRSLWDCFTDVILEPLLFAFVVLLLFTRFQNIIEFTTSHPEYSFWQILESDMHLSPVLYISFYVVFILWVVAKGLKYQRDRRQQKQMDNIVDKLDKIDKGIEGLSISARKQQRKTKGK